MTEENEFGTPIHFDDQDGDVEPSSPEVGEADAHDENDAAPEKEAPEILEDLFLSPDSESSVAEVAEAGEVAVVDNALIQELNDKLVALEEERDDLKNRLMRSAADLENFRKRAAREREDLRKYGIDRVVQELLPALDNLERALDHAEKTEAGANIAEGVRMVSRQFVSSLEKHGVVQFDARGEQFDPQKHEAIQQVESSEHDTGVIVEQYQKGYFLHDRLLRPALVAVAKRVEAPQDSVSNEEDQSQPVEEEPIESAESEE